MPKPHRVTSAKQLDDAVMALIAADKRFGPVVKRAGKPVFVPRRRHGFEALMGIITSQQLSTAAGDTIFGRVKAKVIPFDPPTLLATSAEVLRACGLSAPKQKHMKTIAAAIRDGSLDLKRVRSMPDDIAREHLTAIKGIGPWTADIYLMSSLGRADVWPVGDVALQASIARALKLRKRPNEKGMEKISQAWRPWRTIAARLFWVHEDAIRKEQREAGKRIMEANQKKLKKAAKKAKKKKSAKRRKRK